jgi:hypothetical protein
MNTILVVGLTIGAQPGATRATRVGLDQARAPGVTEAVSPQQLVALSLTGEFSDQPREPSAVLLQTGFSPARMRYFKGLGAVP